MTRWYSEKKKEHFYKEAKRVGYRARSAFKLKQIQEKFNILKKATLLSTWAQPQVDGVRLPRKLSAKELLLVLILHQLVQLKESRF